MMSYKIHSEVFGPYKNFIHILEDVETKEAIIFDPAWDANYIMDRIQQLDVKPVAIWLTHGHHDHTNALNDLREKINLPVYASHIEIDFIKNVPEATATGIFLPLPEDVIGIKGGDLLKVGNTAVKILHTPGHSSGSLCFLLTDDMITGDTLFVDGCGRTDLPGSDPDAMFDSLTKIVNTVPHHVVIHTGHAYGRSDTDTLASQIETNPFLRRTGRDEFVNYRMGR